MEIRFMKQDALDTLKGSLENIYTKYFTEAESSWVETICPSPFGNFCSVPDFELVMPNEVLTIGDIEIENCKRIYENLKFLTESQAADERLWAGLCHDLFYDYVRRRFGYDANKTDFVTATDDETEKFNSAVDKEINQIKNRFFLNGAARAELMQNPLARYWWTGHTFYDEGNGNRFAKLDLIGANDFYTKVFSTLTRAFASNPEIFAGVVKFLDYCRQHGIEVNADKNLRPALKEVNKVGGAVILDCLTADEIADIMIACVKPRTIVHDDKPVDEPPKPEVDDTRAVKFGNKVKLISLDNGKQRNYIINKRFQKNFPGIYDALIGKQINSVVTLKDGKFTITDIK